MKFADYELELGVFIVFQNLMKFRSVSQTAKHLDLSQPAVSRKLSKLRDHFQDQLFVRTGRGLAPTPFAIELEPHANEIVAVYQKQFQNIDQFEASSATRKFTIASSEVGQKLLLPPLFEKCSKIAPNVSITTTRPNNETLIADLESGDVDIALGAYPKLYSGIFEKTLATETYTCAVRVDHPEISGEMSVDQFMKADHVVVSTKGLGHIHRQIEKFLIETCPKDRVKVVCDNFSTAALLAEQTDCIATLPSRLAHTFGGRLKLQFLPPPVRVPDFEIKLYWHERFHQASANKWLRDMISSVIR